MEVPAWDVTIFAKNLSLSDKAKWLARSKDDTTTCNSDFFPLLLPPLLLLLLGERYDTNFELLGKITLQALFLANFRF